MAREIMNSSGSLPAYFVRAAIATITVVSVIFAVFGLVYLMAMGL